MSSPVPGRGRRAALVHDWLNQIGGAEYVLEVLVRMFPGAPVFTSMYAADRMPAMYRSWDIRTTFMQHLPGVTRHHQPYMPVYPLAFGRVNLAGYDLILSNKSGFCHGVHAPPGARHVCYCLAPTRFLWQYEAYAARESLGKAADLMLKPLVGAAAAVGLRSSTAGRSFHRDLVARYRRASAGFTAAKAPSSIRRWISGGSARARRPRAITSWRAAG